VISRPLFTETIPRARQPRHNLKKLPRPVEARRRRRPFLLPESPNGSERNAHRHRCAAHRARRSMQLKGEDYSSGFLQAIQTASRNWRRSRRLSRCRFPDAATLQLLLRSGCGTNSHQSAARVKERKRHSIIIRLGRATRRTEHEWQGRSACVDMWDTCVRRNKRIRDRKIRQKKRYMWRVTIMEIAATKLMQWFNELRSRVHLYLHVQTRKSSPDKRVRGLIQ